MLGYVFHITYRFDTHNIIKVQFFLNPFSKECTIEKNSNLLCEFNFAKLDTILKIKPGSDCIYNYEKLKLSQSFEIYVRVHDENHELGFCNRIPNEKH